MTTSLESRVAMITGCGKDTGIGAAIARTLSARGAHVVITDAVPTGVNNLSEVSADTKWQGLPSLVAEIEGKGGRALAVTGDVTSEAETQAMVDVAMTAFGRIDILVNNAGAPQGLEFADIADVPLEAWESVLAINLRGPFLMTRAAVKPMRARGWGRIINMASSAGRTGYGKQAAYSASKAGLIGMTRSVAKDVAGHGITVNAICPGWIRTSRSYNSARRVSQDVDAELARRGALVPVGRLGTPEDVAAMAAFLASEEASYLTGQTYDVDGGLLMA